jgi:hypothetical protein
LNKIIRTESGLICGSYMTASYLRLCLYSVMLSSLLLPQAAAVLVTSNTHTHYMKLALRHAQHAFREKEVPIGAVLVDEQGIVVAAARNRVEGLRDASAHVIIVCPYTYIPIPND